MSNAELICNLYNELLLILNKHNYNFETLNETKTLEIIDNFLSKLRTINTFNYFLNKDVIIFKKIKETIITGKKTEVIFNKILNSSETDYNELWTKLFEIYLIHETNNDKANKEQLTKLRNKLNLDENNNPRHNLVNSNNEDRAFEELKQTMDALGIDSEMKKNLNKLKDNPSHDQLLDFINLPNINNVVNNVKNFVNNNEQKKSKEMLSSILNKIKDSKNEEDVHNNIMEAAIDCANKIKNGEASLQDLFGFLSTSTIDNIDNSEFENLFTKLDINKLFKTFLTNNPIINNENVYLPPEIKNILSTFDFNNPESFEKAKNILDSDLLNVISMIKDKVVKTNDDEKYILNKTDYDKISEYVKNKKI